MAAENRADRLRWFTEARFGMFVHWGLYSITGRDMWYYSTEEVDKDHYERLARRFDPVDYDPASWAKLAKRAGMRYAVLTTKHHDGFCLWDSKYTDFKVTNSPYGKDLVRPWLDAYRAEGIKVGLYHSVIDWHHPHFTVDFLHPQRRNMESLNKERDIDVYVEYLHNQVRELLTDFGKIDILWPDFAYESRPDCPGKGAKVLQSEKLIAMAEELQPGIIYNDRLGTPGELKADFTTPEQYVPKEDVSRKDTDALAWEACETIGASWGYFRGDRDIKSPTRIVADLVRCASHNGNLLLNVGPTPRGRIQPEFQDCLKQVGEWMDVHGESIYGAGSAQLPEIAMGCPERHYTFTQRGRDLYLHFFDRYPPSNLILRGLKPEDVDYAELVSDRTEVEFDAVEIESRYVEGQESKREPTVRLRVPVITPDPHDTVVRIVLRDHA